MIKFEQTETYGWGAAIRGMRNPKNSWNRSDSAYTLPGEGDHWPGTRKAIIGPNDMELMKTLNLGGPVHAKYRRMITVTVDITAPLYWWKEFDTYKVGTVANSCSTMHKLPAKEFTLDDFSHEHLDDLSLDCLNYTITKLNANRNEYLSWDDKDATAKDKKHYWWQMIQLLPSSYNQKRTVQLTYEVLVGIHRWRKDHKLDEWHDFCDWIRALPYSELIIGSDMLEKKMNIAKENNT